MADVLKKVPVREQDAKVRATNFEEVCLGYNMEEAMEEASRCLNCKNAKCIQGCPVSIDIPAFIQEVKEGNIEEISPTDEITKALFNIDMDAEGSNSVRSRQKAEAEDKEASNIYKAGSVVVFKNLKKNKFGIMIIRSVNVDFDAVKATNDANATITFDLYYQRY